MSRKNDLQLWALKISSQGWRIETVLSTIDVHHLTRSLDLRETNDGWRGESQLINLAYFNQQFDKIADNILYKKDIFVFVSL